MNDEYTRYLDTVRCDWCRSMCDPPNEVSCDCEKHAGESVWYCSMSCWSAAHS